MRARNESEGESKIMTDITTISAEVRERAGKGAARAERRAGRVPAVIYGNKEQPVGITLAPRDLHKEMHQPGFFTRLFDVNVNGQTHRVLPRDVQMHPLKDVPIHVDFMRVSDDTTITVAVPVVFQNEELSPGLKRGGVLNIVRHEVDLICRAISIPRALEANLDGLEIGDSIHISHIHLPDDVRTVITDRDFTVATVAAPSALKSAEEEEAEAAAAEAAEAEAAEAEGGEAKAEGEAKEEGKGKSE